MEVDNVNEAQTMLREKERTLKIQRTIKTSLSAGKTCNKCNYMKMYLMLEGKLALL